MRVNSDDEFSELGLSNDTVVLLNQLIKRKRKLEKVKFLNTVVLMMSIILILFFVSSLSNKNSVNNVQNMLAYFTSTTSMYLIVITIGLFVSSRSLSQKYKKTKEKYEDLRKETITKLKVDWAVNDYRSEKRDKLSKILSSKDINIRYKS